MPVQCEVLSVCYQCSVKWSAINCWSEQPLATFPLPWPCGLNTLQCTLYTDTVQCTVYTVHCSLYSVKYIVWCTRYSPYCAVYSVQDTEKCAQCCCQFTVYRLNFVFIAFGSLQTIESKLDMFLVNAAKLNEEMVHFRKHNIIKIRFLALPLPERQTLVFVSRLRRVRHTFTEECLQRKGFQQCEAVLTVCNCLQLVGQSATTLGRLQLYWQSASALTVWHCLKLSKTVSTGNRFFYRVGPCLTMQLLSNGLQQIGANKQIRENRRKRTRRRNGKGKGTKRTKI